MPNYSKPTTYFSSRNKKIEEIPWSSAKDIYADILANAKDNKQAELDEEHREFLLRKEEEWSSSHEAPYEGNFSEEYPPKVAIVSTKEMNQLVAAALETEFIEKYIKAQIDWVMPQIITLIGNMPTFKNKNGLLSGLQFRRENFRTDMHIGIYRFLLFDKKSSYLTTQYKAPHKSYCSLVPIIMYAHKLMHGTPYRAWDPLEIRTIVGEKLADAMLADYGDISKDELIRERNEGLITRTGKGGNKSPLSTHKLYGPQLETGPLAGLPEYAQVMLTQIWCAHPENRTRYMVLDPKNWDRMPPALIEDRVIKQVSVVDEAW